MAGVPEKDKAVKSAGHIFLVSLLRFDNSFGHSMTLQNRVDPFGVIHAVPDRGLFTGNRGIIHDPDTRTLLKRRWSTKAWIICRFEFGDRRRDVMGRNGRTGGAGWTELFFLDEVTALAAGHRPCFFCRREDARTFAGAFAKGQGEKHLAAADIDRRLHLERRASGRGRVPLDRDLLLSLPDGTMIEHEMRPYAVKDSRLLPWSFGGYGEPRNIDMKGSAPALITPPVTVAALQQGYRPTWHPSAGT